MEKISVIIPAYNRANKIVKSVESVLQQTYNNIEVLIIDDASTDNTEEVVRGIKDDRVRYVKLPKNRGASGARNEGVRLAETELIAFHDSDDTWRPNKLEKQMAYWEMHPEFSMIYCQYELHKGEYYFRVPAKSRGNLEGDILPYILEQNAVGTGTMLLKKSCFDEVGGFNEDLNCLEDWEFVLRFAELFLVGFVEEILADAFFSEGSVSTRWLQDIETRCYIIARYRKYMIQYDVFDKIVSNLFKSAEEMNVLEEVKKMLMLYLTMM